MNATQCYAAMAAAIAASDRTRRVSDPASPTAGVTMREAKFGAQFRLSEPCDNVVGCAPVDRRWALANALHFFAATEEAGALRRYNKHADRFLVGDRWVGAYGAVAVPQMRECIKLLREDQFSRRAIVSMGGFPAEATINVPACWSFLHFQATGDELSALVYQRSLSLRVMPYDCVVLTNVLRHVADECDMLTGELVWTVGNLHAPDIGSAEWLQEHPQPLHVPNELARDPWRCYECLTGDLVERAAG